MRQRGWSGCCWKLKPSCLTLDLEVSGMEALSQDRNVRLSLPSGGWLDLVLLLRLLLLIDTR